MFFTNAGLLVINHCIHQNLFCFGLVSNTPLIQTSLSRKEIPWIIGVKNPRITQDFGGVSFRGLAISLQCYWAFYSIGHTLREAQKVPTIPVSTCSVTNGFGKCSEIEFSCLDLGHVLISWPIPMVRRQSFANWPGLDYIPNSRARQGVGPL